MGQYYEIVSIQPTESPFGEKGSNWYRYVIAFEGSNSITGYRQGNLKSVTNGLIEMVAELNNRHWNKRDRGSPISAPKNKS